MKLFEFEAKKLIAKAGIRIPRGKSIRRVEDLEKLQITFDATAVKAQLLQGNRAAQGGIVLCDDLASTRMAIKKMLHLEINHERVKCVLVEQKVATDREHYVAFTYDSIAKTPLVLFSLEGGSGAEEHLAQSTVRQAINLCFGSSEFIWRSVLYDAGVSLTEVPALVKTLEQLWQIFIKYDCRLLEINPLVRTLDGRYIVEDCKMVVDDVALYRQPRLSKLGKRQGAKKLTIRERQAKAIDAGNYHGTAGSSYLELDGNIAIISSGGGASLCAFDAFKKAALGTNLKPANFTEYSGNPPRAKVAELVRITLLKPGLKGCWILGGEANFTDIFETMSGVVEALSELQQQPRYPFVIRRGGPRADEAFKMLKEVGETKGYKFILQTPETTFLESAQSLVKAVKL